MILESLWFIFSKYGEILYSSWSLSWQKNVQANKVAEETGLEEKAG